MAFHHRLLVIAFLATSMTGLFLPRIAYGAASYVCPFLGDEKRRQLDEMTQGNDGWFFRINNDFREDFTLYPETAAYLSRLAHALEAHGTTLVMIPLPVRAMAGHVSLNRSIPVQEDFNNRAALHSYHAYIQALEKAGLIAVNLASSEADLNPDHYFRRDIHWTPEGARATAEKTARMLMSLPRYASLHPASYETRRTGEATMRGKTLQEIERLCSSPVPAESFPVYETRLKASGAQALFGSGDAASVLVGTSYSDMDMFNFMGFLSQYSGLAIANYAIGAGELFNAMISYVSAPEFVQTHPPFLLWEMPGHYNINIGSAASFRQIIPAISGDCANKAVAANEFEVKEGKGGTLLTVAPEKNVSGSSYYLSLASDTVSLATFTLEMEYADGDGEWFTIDRSQHFRNHGRFFVELSDDIGSALTSVTLHDLDYIDAHLEVRLCKAT